MSLVLFLLFIIIDWSCFGFSRFFLFLKSFHFFLHLFFEISRNIFCLVGIHFEKHFLIWNNIHCHLDHPIIKIDISSISKNHNHKILMHLILTLVCTSHVIIFLRFYQLLVFLFQNFWLENHFAEG